MVQECSFVSSVGPRGCILLYNVLQIRTSQKRRSKISQAVWICITRAACLPTTTSCSSCRNVPQPWWQHANLKLISVQNQLRTWKCQRWELQSKRLPSPGKPFKDHYPADKTMMSPQLHVKIRTASKKQPPFGNVDEYINVITWGRISLLCSSAGCVGGMTAGVSASSVK